MGAPRTLVLALAVALAALAFLVLLARGAAPHVLWPAPGAAWIVPDDPLNLQASPVRPATVAFSAVVHGPGSGGETELAALGSVRLAVNGQPVDALRTADEGAGRTRAWYALGAHLVPGVNRIDVTVTRASGPPALRVGTTSGELPGPQAWQASRDGLAWRPVRRADARALRPAMLARWHAGAGVAAYLPALLGFAAFGALAVWGAARAAAGWMPGARLLAAWQAALLAGLAALFAWNAGRLPSLLGMDVRGHLEYVDYLLIRRALPYADEGWQLFQPPLAYLAGAAAEVARARWFSTLAAIEVLRGLAMACGLAAAAVACRCCALAFRRQPASAAFAMTVAVSLPAGLYMAQAFGNEVFAATFGTLLVWEAAALLAAPAAAATRTRALRIGLWAGLGLLAKPTVLLMLPGVGTVLALRAWQAAGGRGAGARTAAVRTAQAALVCMAVAGWWYARNALRFGRPFVGGWEAGRGYDWWQYPGYRIPEHLLRFGEALSRPYYAGLDSFWDAMHASLWLDGNLSGALRPELLPWNHTAMAALALLALPWGAAIAAGALRAVRPGPAPPERALALFCAATVGVLLAAMLLMYARVPAYSPAKGSYLLPAAACLAILAGHGAAPLLARAWGRVAAGAYAAAWLGAVALAFAVR